MVIVPQRNPGQVWDDEDIDMVPDGHFPCGLSPMGVRHTGHRGWLCKQFSKQSVQLAQFLYSKSTHSKVKEGEMYLAHFSNVPFETEYVDAIGIFKSETKETFLKVFPHGQSWEVIAEDGVNINKLDKGCLIFRKNQSEGYVDCVVDNTNKQQDAQYWSKTFYK